MMVNYPGSKRPPCRRGFLWNIFKMWTHFNAIWRILETLSWCFLLTNLSNLKVISDNYGPERKRSYMYLYTRWQLSISFLGSPVEVLRSLSQQVGCIRIIFRWEWYFTAVQCSSFFTGNVTLWGEVIVRLCLHYGDFHRSYNCIPLQDQGWTSVPSRKLGNNKSIMM